MISKIKIKEKKMNLLLSAFGDWFSKNWIILVLIVLAIALLVPTYLRQKKEANARNELNNTIKNCIFISISLK